MPRGIYQHKLTQGFKKGHKTEIGWGFEKGYTPWNKGKKASEIARINQGLSHKGEKSHWWKGGITSENHIIRYNIEARLWRESVFARDNWTDQKTGIRGGKLVAHHISNFAEIIELRTSIENGITLSDKSHREFHKRYGFRNNTREQIIEFLKN